MIVWFDTETTGLNPKDSQIIEIAFIETDWKLNPVSWGNEFLTADFKNFPPSKKSLEINGFSQELWDSNGVDRKEFFKWFQGFTSGKHLAGQNMKFDMGFLEEEYSRIGVKPKNKRTYLDTYTAFFMKNLLEGSESPFEGVALSRMAESYGMVQPEPHNALSDTLLTLNLFRATLGMAPISEEHEIYKFESQILDLRKGVAKEAPVSERPKATKKPKNKYTIFVGEFSEDDSFPSKDLILKKDFNSSEDKPWLVSEEVIKKDFTKDMLDKKILLYNNFTKKGFYMKIKNENNKPKINGCSKARSING